MRPEPASAAQWPELLQLWEESVRASHRFLSEEDIRELRAFLQGGCPEGVDLRVLRGPDGRIAAFMGVAGRRLEMLFVRPDAFRRGLGGLLARHAVGELGVCEVDVNEANPQALAFYRSLGFRVAARSELDGQRRPFPLLTLRLPET